MNNQVSKIIRKWAKLRKLDYKTCKHMYERLSNGDKCAMVKEAKSYISLVESGVLKPAPPRALQRIQEETKLKSKLI